MSAGPHIGGVDVSRETIERLKGFEALFKRWNSTINLVSKATIGDMWGRHIADSAQILPLIPPKAQSIADLGSGGGFPGIVLAAIAKETAPDQKFDLIESDGRKAAFLMTAAHQLKLNVAVHSQRVETLPNHAYDVVTSRALAPLGQLVSYAKNLLRPGGVAIFPKGKNHAMELEQALEKWRFSVQKHDSITAADAVILVIGDIERA